MSHHRDDNGHDGKRRRGKELKDKNDDRPVILVDAANVAFESQDGPHEKPSVRQLRRMTEILEGYGFKPIVVADASLRHKVDEPDQLEKMIDDGDVLQAPAHTDADYFLLTYAEREDLPIVTNDLFRDREQEFPHAVKRRVPFMVIDDDILIEENLLEQVVGHPVSSGRSGDRGQR